MEALQLISSAVSSVSIGECWLVCQVKEWSHDIVGVSDGDKRESLYDEGMGV